jgi:predicted nucleic acid-binding protein
VRYLDTSSLVALYFPEEKTEALIGHLHSRPLPLVVTALHEIEFTNGLQLKLFRREATAEAVRATLDLFRSDIETGVSQRTELAWPRVFAEAIRLSVAYSASLGTRTLDLMHIAAAIALEASEFITSDERQAKAAAKARLKVVQL